MARAGTPALLGLVVAVAAIAPPARAEDAPADVLELRSTLKGTFLLARPREVTPLTPDESQVVSLWRLRLEPRASPTGWLTLYAAYEHRVRLGSTESALDSPGLPPGDADAPWRVVPAAGALAQGGTFAWWHELDRLAAVVRVPHAELTVGRQAVGWGRGVLFGAVDVFSPFTPLEVDREWRRGVDAARLDVQLGARASAEVLGVFSDPFEASAVAGRLRGYLGPVDAELVGGWRAGDGFAGVSASASVLDAELHGELAAFVLEEPWRHGGTFGNDRVVLKAVAGASYQVAVGEGLRLLAEYHFNGFGLEFPVSVAELARDDAFTARLRRGDFQTLGRHLLAAGASYEVGMTLGLGVQLLVDPSDGSGLLAPSLSWDLAESVSLVAAGYVGWGLGPAGLDLRSQLGATPLTFLLRLQVYDARGVPRPPPGGPP